MPPGSGHPSSCGSPTRTTPASASRSAGAASRTLWRCLLARPSISGPGCWPTNWLTTLHIAGSRASRRRRGDRCQPPKRRRRCVHSQHGTRLRACAPRKPTRRVAHSGCRSPARCAVLSGDARVLHALQSTFCAARDSSRGHRRSGFVVRSTAARRHGVDADSSGPVSRRHVAAVTASVLDEAADRYALPSRRGRSLRAAPRLRL